MPWKLTESDTDSVTPLRGEDAFGLKALLYEREELLVLRRKRSPSGYAPSEAPPVEYLDPRFHDVPLETRSGNTEKESKRSPVSDSTGDNDGRNAAGAECVEMERECISLLF